MNMKEKDTERTVMEMKDKFCRKLISMLLLLFACSTSALAATSGCFVVSDAAGKAGDTVEVEVSIENNPGIISAAMEIHYDTDKLELIKVNDKKMMPDSIFSQYYTSYPYYASWMDALAKENMDDDGVLMTMTFRIAEDCVSGVTPVTLTFKPGNVFDCNLQEKAFVAVDGSVTVSGSSSSGGSSSGGSSSGSGSSGGSSSGSSSSTPVVDESSLYGVFDDLAADAWYSSYVEYMLQKGYMKGVSETGFDPHGSVTRAQLVTILYRIEGSPAVIGQSAVFADVKASAWYADAVAWAAANGIVNGVSADSFAPDANITREQFAAILYRYNGSQKDAVNHLGRFTDHTAVSSYAVDAMNWAVGAGIMNGLSDTSLGAFAEAERVQAAAMLTRFVGLDTMIPLPSEPSEKK